MTRTVPNNRLPALVYGVVLCTAGVALALTPLADRASGLVEGRTAIGAAVVLAVLIVLAQRLPVHAGPKRKTNAGTAAEVAAVLLLPGLLAVAAVVAGSIAGELFRRVRFAQRVFNPAVAALRAVAGALVFSAFAPDAGTISEAAGAILAATAMYAVTLVLVQGMVAVQRRRSPLTRSALPSLEQFIVEVTLSFTGILGAFAAAGHPWTLLLLPAPALLAHRAVRDSVALQEKTRVANEALSEARSALATREEFLSVASHELKTPLTALKSYVALVRRRVRRGAPSSDLQQILGEAESQVDRLTALVADLLDVSRLAAGWAAVQRVPSTLDDLVQRAVSAERVAEPGRAFIIKLPRPPVVAVMDPARIEQVLVNLLENARKYSPPDRPVYITGEAHGRAVHLRVRDEGVGIPSEDQERIFDRFHRAGNIDRGVSGLGLGLYIAHELVRAHGGRLEVQSKPGQGSTFTIILPNAVVDSPTSMEAVGSRQ